jgi:hypothetical protein
MSASATIDMGVFERLDGTENEAITAANPSGINAYDKGKSFEQATGGVQRDYHGRFAPEGGKNRSERRRRRDKRARQMKSARLEKEAKKSKTTKDKATRDREKAARDAIRAREKAQQEVLAGIRLRISIAAAEGDTIKAAELRVEYAERRLKFADGNKIEVLNAAGALARARAALARARRAAAAKKNKKKASQRKQTGGRTSELNDYEQFYSDHGRYPNADELKNLKKDYGGR